MRWTALALVGLASACWREQVRVAPPPPPAKVEFRALQGAPWQVVVVDVAARLPPERVTRARAAVETQLREAGVTVVDDATQQLRFEATRAVADPASLQQCVTVSAQVVRTTQAFLPSRPHSATRCSGEGAPATRGDDAFFTFILAGEATLKNVSGGEERSRTEAFVAALQDVLTRVGAQP
ncbi:MAG: hypothetical protein IT380_28675 [Myxococcales bacterium]|nr:hypothetical protein [Myxococcales bacterium]